VLQSFAIATRTDYLYGLSRLATQTSSVRTWYVSDALGSVRRTVSDAGVPLGVVTYDPWGSVESGTVPMFDFTGELQPGGHVYLRTRWYSSAQGRFASVDPAAGVAETPYSLYPYAYGSSNPVLYGDPSGRCGATGQGDDYCHPEGIGSAGGIVPVVPPPGVGTDGRPPPNPFLNVPRPEPMTMPEVPPVSAPPVTSAGPSILELHVSVWGQPCCSRRRWH
jgi:RHS repeat-associated protein